MEHEALYTEQEDGAAVQNGQLQLIDGDTASVLLVVGTVGFIALAAYAISKGHEPAVDIMGVIKLSF